MLKVVPAQAAPRLDAWFRSLRGALDLTLFSVGSDEPHRRASVLTVLTRHVGLLEAAADQPVVALREVAFVLAAATHRLGVVPSEREWHAAVNNFVVLDAQLSEAARYSAWVPSSAVEVFRDQFAETLRHAGVAQRPTSLDAANRRTALGLSVNWGMRYLVAVAASLADVEVTDRAAREVVTAVFGR
jgi:hypothetical protein